MLFSILESKKQEGQVKEKNRNIIQVFLRAGAFEFWVSHAIEFFLFLF